MKCYDCGIQIPEMPENSTADMLRCDNCEADSLLNGAKADIGEAFDLMSDDSMAEEHIMSIVGMLKQEIESRKLAFSIAIE